MDSQANTSRYWGCVAFNRCVLMVCGLSAMVLDRKMDLALGFVFVGNDDGATGVVLPAVHRAFCASLIGSEQRSRLGETWCLISMEIRGWVRTAGPSVPASCSSQVDVVLVVRSVSRQLCHTVVSRTMGFKFGLSQGHRRKRHSIVIHVVKTLKQVR